MPNVKGRQGGGLRLILDLREGEEDTLKVLCQSARDVYVRITGSCLTHWEDLCPEKLPLFRHSGYKLDLIVIVELGFESQHARTDKVP